VARALQGIEDGAKTPSGYLPCIDPQVDCPRAVGASEGGRDGHAEEAIDSKGRRQGDAISSVGRAIDPVGPASEGVPIEA